MLMHDLLSLSQKLPHGATHELDLDVVDLVDLVDLLSAGDAKAG